MFPYFGHTAANSEMWCVWSWIWFHRNISQHKLQIEVQWKCCWIIFYISSITCVNSVIEIPLSLQCKIVQYKFLWQYPMKFQDFLSMCQVHLLAWLQLDHRKLGPSEMRFFRPLYHRTEKHALKCEKHSLGYLLTFIHIKNGQKYILLFNNH